MVAGVRVYLVGEPIGRQLRERTAKQSLSAMAWGISGGAREAGAEILLRGRQDISSAGNFGIRWVHGFKVSSEPRYGALLNARIELSHGLWFAFIHEFGGVIRGKPLLWIPLSFARDALGIWARDYNRHVAPLFRLDRPGKRPLLLSKGDRQPKYFGIEQVYIPKRWHLREITDNVMRTFSDKYNKHMVKGIRT